MAWGWLPNASHRWIRHRFPAGDRTRLSFWVREREVGIEFIDGLREGLITWFGDWFTNGLVIGLGFALVAGLQGPWGTVNNRTSVPSGLRFGLFVGLMMGLLTGLNDALIVAPATGLVSGLYKGLIVGLGYGFVVALGRRRLPWQSGRLRWSKTDRRTVPIVGLGSALAAGLIVGLPVVQIAGVRIFGRGFGFQEALVVGLVIGLLTTLLVGLGRPSPDATRPVGPRSLWRRKLGVGVGVGVGVGIALVIGVGFGVLIWRFNGPVNGLAVGLQIGLGAGLVSSGTWTTTLVSAQLRRRDQAPVRLVRFLDDARTRNILRTVGSVYQFRHARLQDWLAETSESVPLA